VWSDLSGVPIAYADVSSFAHATEDEIKVIEATRKVLPATQLEDIVFNRRYLQGHHGNPIVFFEARITEKEVLKIFVENLASNLCVFDKKTLLKEVSSHVDKGKLYLRFDKQAAFRGTLKLGVADPIHVRLRFNKNKLEDVVNICKKIGLLP
jgi:RNA binding exosome subunit